MPGPVLDDKALLRTVALRFSSEKGEGSFGSSGPGNGREENYQHRIRYTVWEFNDGWSTPPRRRRVVRPPPPPPAPGGELHEPVFAGDGDVFPALFRSWKETTAGSRLWVSEMWERILGVKEWANRRSLPRLVDSTGRVVDWGQDLPWGPFDVDIEFTGEHNEERENLSEQADGGDGPGNAGGPDPQGSFLSLAAVNAAR